MHPEQNNEEFAKLTDLPNLAEKRARIYWFLADFYSVKPTTEFLKELRERIQNIHYHDDVDEDLKKLKEFLDKFDDSEVVDLQVRFTRLFRGIKKGYGPPPPYESIYRGEQRVCGEWTFRAMTFYHNCGFGVIDDSVGPQDHITAELRFMAMLCIKEKESLKQNNGSPLFWMRKELYFLENHILQWVPRYCVTIEQENDGFYSTIARITKRWIESDSDYIRATLSSLSKGLP